MRALGRILQVIGWLLLLAAVAERFVGSDRLSIFPGLVIIFIARVIRAQADRTQPRDPQVEEPAEEATTPERVLNTERRHQTPSAPPPSPQPAYMPPVPESEPLDEEPEETDELIERIVAAGRETAEEVEAREASTELELDHRPMSSEEMIARAHRRWDSRRG